MEETHKNVPDSTGNLQECISMRLGPRVCAKARRAHVLLPYLLGNGLDQAQRELVWLEKEFKGRDLISACMRRHKHEPIQYILGSQPFLHLDIKCHSGVLIPRWETEEWVNKLCQALRQSKSLVRILDMCTGSGCIGLALGSILATPVSLTDISPCAIALTRENMLRNAKCTGKSPFMCFQADMFQPRLLLSKLGRNHVNLITANPPYISDSEFVELPRSVRDYEPCEALVGGSKFYQSLIEYLTHLQSDGLVCEVGNKDQIDFVMKNAPQGFSGRGFRDSGGNPRLAVLYRRGSEMELLKSIQMSRV